MKYNKFKICVMWLTGLAAQEVIPAAGGAGSGSGGAISYSVWHLFYSTYSGETVKVVEGVQQPFEISVVTGIEELIRFNFSSSEFPNPTVDILTILVEDKEILNLSYMLLDAYGRLLQNGRITGPETRLNLKEHPFAIYFLKVTDHPRWNSHANVFGTDNYGFGGLPGGNRSSDGAFYSLGSDSFWWSSTSSDVTNAWRRVMHLSQDVFNRSAVNKKQGFNVRCARPAP